MLCSWLRSNVRTKRTYIFQLCDTLRPQRIACACIGAMILLGFAHTQPHHKSHIILVVVAKNMCSMLLCVHGFHTRLMLLSLGCYSHKQTHNTLDSATRALTSFTPNEWKIVFPIQDVGCAPVWRRFSAWTMIIVRHHRGHHHHHHHTAHRIVTKHIKYTFIPVSVFVCSSGSMVARTLTHTHTWFFITLGRTPSNSHRSQQRRGRRKPLAPTHTNTHTS